MVAVNKGNDDYEFAETEKKSSDPEEEVPNEEDENDADKHSFIPEPEDESDTAVKDENQIASLSWMWGTEEDPNEEGVERFPNAHTGVDTIVTTSHAKGYLWKKKKDPTNNVVLDANRWFVFDIREGELDYFQSHEPNSRGSKALTMLQFNQIIKVDSFTFQVKTYFYNDEHRTRVQSLNLKASTAQECDAWIECLEGARIRFLIEVNPLIRGVQKRVRGWLYRRHLVFKKKEEAEQILISRTALGRSIAMFVLAFLFFLLGLCFTSTRDMDDGRGKCYGIVERISGIKNDPNADWLISNVNNSYPAFGAGLNDYLKSPILKLKVTSASGASFASSVGNSFTSGISGIFGSPEGSSVSSTPAMYRPMNKTLMKEFMDRAKGEAERTVPLLRGDYGNLKNTLISKMKMNMDLDVKYETSVDTMDAFSGFDGSHYMTANFNTDNRNNAGALLRIKAKWYATKADADSVTLIIAVHTDDLLDCRVKPRDWRCSLSASLLSEIEKKALEEFSSEHISVHHYGNPHASFFTLDFDQRLRGGKQ